MDDVQPKPRDAALVGRVVKNGSNTWRLTYRLMPQPSSENSTSTLSARAPARDMTDPPCVREGMHRGIEHEIGEHLAVGPA